MSTSRSQMKAQSRAAMAKAAQARATPKPAAVNPNDPTPERMRHGTSITEAPPVIADEPRTVLKVRRFRTTKVDQLYSEHKITRAQRDAAEWWRSKQEAGLGLPRVVADYGQSNGGGASRDPSPIPITDKAEAARAALTAAKMALSLAHRMWIEDVLDDPHARVVGRASQYRTNRWRAGLHALAVYLEYEKVPSGA